jgi:hypothetical protein
VNLQLICDTRLACKIVLAFSNFCGILDLIRTSLKLSLEAVRTRQPSYILREPTYCRLYCRQPVIPTSVPIMQTATADNSSHYADSHYADSTVMQTTCMPTPSRHADSAVMQTQKEHTKMANATNQRFIILATSSFNIIEST